MSDWNFNSNSVDAKLATIIANQANADQSRLENHIAVMKRLDGQDERLRSLEGSRKWFAGVVAAVMGLLEYIHWKTR
jgi:hypothetical protein